MGRDGLFSAQFKGEPPAVALPGLQIPGLVNSTLGCPVLTVLTATQASLARIVRSPSPEEWGGKKKLAVMPTANVGTL